MTKRQRLVVVLLAIADCVVLGGLIVAVVFTPRMMGRRASGGLPTAQPTDGLLEATGTLPATWTFAPSPTPRPTATRLPTTTPAPTRTPLTLPTGTPTPSPTPQPVSLRNSDFEDILPDSVPGWEVASVVNWQPGDEYDPGLAYARPEFKPADDVQRVINGTTLQIQTFQWVRFKVTLYQTVEVEPGSRVQFQIYARGYSSGAGIEVRAGIDPSGAAACQEGAWSELQVINQASGIVTLRSPEVVAGGAGDATVCFFAEPQYALIHNAAFFDDASLIVVPPELE